METVADRHRRFAYYNKH